MKFLFSTFFFFSSLLLIAFPKTAEEWKSRSVYQIITDRFARTNGDSTACDNFYNYCGGTFKGILNNLDYIQGMGFDAIWISPVVANTPGGYHGYWTSNLYEINENFGTPEELIELIDSCHEKDIWVMVDVVANHMGYVDMLNNTHDVSKIVPFSDISHYNTYKHCDEIDFGHQESVESCWLNGLPDLDQNNAYVKETFLNWARDFVQTYNIDALRIDTVPHVPKSFWADFSKAAGVYTIGEVLNFNLPYLASYQGPMDAVLNYALYSTLRYTFQNGGSMNSLEAYYDGAKATWPDMTVLGNFVDNHDNARFLSNGASHEAFKSALAFTISSVGIPMVYYGDEQAYGGGQDPMNREPLWTNMDTDTDIYRMLKTLNNFRKSTQFYKYDQVQRYSDDQVYAFSRGDYFFAFTNTHDYQTKNINYHSYPEGTVLCNILHREDCVEVKNGEFPIVLINGEFKVFAPSNNDQEEPQGIEGVWKGIKLSLGSSAFNVQSL